MKYYFVESYSRWFVCLAANKRKAKSEGVEDWGRGSVKTVRLATDADISEYRGIRPGVLPDLEQMFAVT